MRSSSSIVCHALRTAPILVLTTWQGFSCMLYLQRTPRLRGCQATPRSLTRQTVSALAVVLSCPLRTNDLTASPLRYSPASSEPYLPHRHRQSHHVCILLHYSPRCRRVAPPTSSQHVSARRCLAMINPLVISGMEHRSVSRYPQQRCATSIGREPRG